MNKIICTLAILGFIGLTACSHTQSKEQGRVPAQSDIGNGSIGSQSRVLCMLGSKEIKAKTIYQCSGGLDFEADSYESLAKMVEEYASKEPSEGDKNSRLQLAWYRCGAVGEKKIFRAYGKEYEVNYGSYWDRNLDTQEKLNHQYINLFQNGKELERASGYNFKPVMTYAIPVNEALEMPIECTLK